MAYLAQRSRGLFIALAVLAISAGAVFAGAPRVAVTSPVSQDEPVVEATPTPEATADEDQDQDEEATETPEAPEAEDGAAPTDSHGVMVSAAAEMDTPDGFPNHGAWVSCVAHLDATTDLATVTALSCGYDGTERNAGKGAQTQSERAAAGKAKAAAGQAKGAAGKTHGKGRPSGS